MIKIGIMIAAFVVAVILFFVLVRASSKRKTMFSRYILALFALIILGALAFCAAYTSSAFADFVANGADPTSGIHHKAALGWGLGFGVLPTVVGAIYMAITFAGADD